MTLYAAAESRMARIVGYLERNHIAKVPMEQIREWAKEVVDAVLVPVEATTEYRLMVKRGGNRPHRYQMRDKSLAAERLAWYQDPDNFRRSGVPEVWIETRTVTEWERETE